MTDNTAPEVTVTETSEAELAAKNAPAVLLVRARERPAVARALLAAAADAGLDPTIVVSTSDGYTVPLWLAHHAGLVLAEDIEPVGEGPTVYAAATENGYDQVRPSADEPVDDAGLGDTWVGLELPAERPTPEPETPPEVARAVEVEQPAAPRRKGGRK